MRVCILYKYENFINEDIWKYARRDEWHRDDGKIVFLDLNATEALCALRAQFADSQ